MIGKVCGTGSYLPNRIVSNTELSQLVDTSDEWIRERTGIRCRHISVKETTSDMASKAAKKAVSNGGIDPGEIELILVATSSPDVIYPSVACVVQKNIRAENALAFDINGACSGFMVAFNTAQAYIRAGVFKTILVIGAESMSRLVDWRDRSTCVLFGDGAGAVLIRAEEGEAYWQAGHSDGMKDFVLTLNSKDQFEEQTESSPGCLSAKSGICMDGQEVFKFAVRKVPELINELLEKSGLETEKIALFILHQANERIVKAVAKKMKVDENRFPTNMENYANTSAASIPILLDELNREGKLKEGQTILLAGFGAGLTWAGCILEW